MFLAASSIDTSIVSEVVTTIKSFMVMFGEYPLNIFIIMGIGGASFGLIKKARRAL